MYTLTTPRGILAADHSKATLEKIQEKWPVEEKTYINEWKDPKEKRNSSRRRRRNEEE